MDKRINIDTDLLPCPFCGGAPDLSFRVFDTASYKTWGVSCCVEMEGDTDREQTIAAWNRRPTRPATGERELPPLPMTKAQYGLDHTLSFCAHDMRQFGRDAIAHYLLKQAGQVGEGGQNG